MDFGHGWRPPPVDGYWRRGGPKAASGFPPEPAIASRRIAISPRDGLARLKVRADFLRVAATRRRAVVPGLILQAAPRPEASAALAPIGVGFTASRRVGNAVIRNRAKRRLRAAASALLPKQGRPGTDYVLIARAGTADRPYAALLADLAAALRRVERDAEAGRAPVGAAR
jgi:ribonuclease P protein component